MLNNPPKMASGQGSSNRMVSGKGSSNRMVSGKGSNDRKFSTNNHNIKSMGSMFVPRHLRRDSIPAAFASGGDKPSFFAANHPAQYTLEHREKQLTEIKLWDTHTSTHNLPEHISKLKKTLRY